MALTEVADEMYNGDDDMPCNTSSSLVCNCCSFCPGSGYFVDLTAVVNSVVRGNILVL
jgi:hypothetical protein